MTSNYVAAVGKDYNPLPEEDLMQSLLHQYKKVIVEAIITTFGLDFFIKDRHGGDVDTIHNIEEGWDTLKKEGREYAEKQLSEKNLSEKNRDKLMKKYTEEYIEQNLGGSGIYKNKENLSNYQNREKFDTAAYHGDKRYSVKVSQAKKEFIEDGKWIDDAYVKGNTLAPFANKTIPRGRQGQLDHTVSAEECDSDPIRILAGVDGKALANSPENLKYTNAALNNNMRNKSAPDYIEWCEKNPAQVNWRGNKGEPLPEELKEELLKNYYAEKDRQKKVCEQAYYVSPKFHQDTLVAASKVGGKMAVRQAAGFMFLEIWFSVEDEFKKIQSPIDLSKVLKSVADGLQKGFENARKKYKELFAKLGEGFIAGFFSSVTTTLINIVLTTSKNTVTLIRRTSASLVQAAEVLFLNPDDYLFGERMRATAKIIATGASVAVGTIVSDKLSKLEFTGVPELAGIIPEFCGMFVTGIMTCTLLFYFDRSKIIGKLVSFLDKIPTISTEVNYFKEQALYFEMYAAELMKIDFKAFREEIMLYNAFIDRIENAKTAEDLNRQLKTCYKELEIKIPWQGDFDSFMSNKNNVLRFE